MASPFAVGTRHCLAVRKRGQHGALPSRECTLIRVADRHALAPTGLSQQGSKSPILTANDSEVDNADLRGSIRKESIRWIQLFPTHSRFDPRKSAFSASSAFLSWWR